MCGDIKAEINPIAKITEAVRTALLRFVQNTARISSSICMLRVFFTFFVVEMSWNRREPAADQGTKRDALAC